MTLREIHAFAKLTRDGKIIYDDIFLKKFHLKYIETKLSWALWSMQFMMMGAKEMRA